MNNKFSSGYKPKLKSKDMQKYVCLFKRGLFNELEENLNIFEQVAPLISPQKINSETSEILVSRSVAFNSASNTYTHFMFNNFDYWLRNRVSELKLENNQGIYINPQYIERDSEINNYSSLTKDKLLIEFSYTGKSIERSAIRKINKIISSVYSVNEKLSKEINDYSNILPSKLKKIDLEKINTKKSIENEMDYISQKEKIAIFSGVETNVRDIYSSNKGKIISVAFWNKRLKKSIEFIKVFERFTYEELYKISKSKTIDKNDEIIHAVESLNKDARTTFGIEVDLDKLFMFILDLEHIEEIKSDIKIDEIKKDLKTI